MMPVSITYLNQVNMATAWLRVRGLATQISGKLNTFRTLSSEHGIKVGFFSRVQNHINLHVEPEFPKVIL